MAIGSAEILKGVRGFLRGTVQKKELKRQLEDRRRNQRFDDLRFDIAERNFAESQIPFAQKQQRALVQSGFLSVVPEGEGEFGPVQAFRPSDSNVPQEELDLFRLQGTKLLTPAQRQTAGQRAELNTLQLDEARRQADDPLGFEARSGLVDQFRNVTRDSQSSIFTPEQIARFKLTGRIPQAPRPKLRQLQVKTPKGQFNVTLDAQGNEINRVRLGDLAPTTSSLIRDIDLSEFPGLDESDIVSVQAAIKRILGGRSPRDIPTIKRLLGMRASGMSIDDIEDRLLTERTSGQFTGAIRNAFEFVTSSGFSQNQREVNRDSLDRVIETQGIEAGKEMILGLARDKANADDNKRFSGRDEALLSLDRIQELLDKFVQAGGKTNLIRGRMQGLSQNVLRVTGEEQLAVIAQEIALAVIDYRQSKSGAAFTASEERAYDRIWPSIENTPVLNFAKIDSLRQAFGRNQKAFYIRGIGKSNYIALFGNEPPPTATTSESPESNPVLEDLFEEMGGND